SDLARGAGDGEKAFCGTRDFRSSERSRSHSLLSDLYGGHGPGNWFSGLIIISAWAKFGRPYSRLDVAEEVAKLGLRSWTTGVDEILRHRRSFSVRGGPR